jgi:hypothetical protein
MKEKCVVEAFLGDFDFSEKNRKPLKILVGVRK